MNKPTYEELDIKVFEYEDVIENLKEQLETAQQQIQQQKNVMNQMSIEIDQKQNVINQLLIKFRTMTLKI